MWKIIVLGFLCCDILGQFARGELGATCEYDEDCEDVDNSVCNSFEVCECDRNYLMTSDNATCLPMATKIGDPCRVPEQCARIPTAECVNNACALAKAVVKLPSLTKPGDGCKEDSDCSFMKGVCKNGTCSLSLPSVSVPSLSVPSVSIPPSVSLPPLSPKTFGLDKFAIGLPCANETDCPVDGATCRDKLCRCMEDFVVSQNLKMCLPKAEAVGDECSETVQCVFLNGSICENGKCVDKIGKFFKNIGEKIPALLIGGTCQNDKECAHLTNALCMENVCQCSEHFVTSITANSCLAKAKKEGDPCEIYKQCEDIKGSTCLNNKCVKPALAGNGNTAGAARTLSQTLAAILFIKMFFV